MTDGRLVDENIQKSLSKIKQQRHLKVLELDLKNVLKELEIKELKIQEKCKHSKTTTHYGYELPSYTSCDICDMEWR